MNTRRSFLAKLGIAPFLFTGTSKFLEAKNNFIENKKVKKLIVISTWDINLLANETAWNVLTKDGRALDAVENGVKVAEADAKNQSVGYGGLPDRDGNVTLDACIMDENANCGAVAYLQNIKHPISVARLVMEKTPHILLVGDGALRFALENGFKKENLLTNEIKIKWKKWLKENKYKPFLQDKDNHDTIGMLALDNFGNLSGACTTSGLSFKLAGRVGDSPIIGAGLYVDNEVGAAAATGKGEAVIKVAGSFLVVEFMRQGNSPQDACQLAIERLIKKNKDFKEFQVGFIALNKNGETGAYAINKDFTYCLYDENGNLAKKSDYALK